MDLHFLAIALVDWLPCNFNFTYAVFDCSQKVKDSFDKITSFAKRQMSYYEFIFIYTDSVFVFRITRFFFCWQCFTNFWDPNTFVNMISLYIRNSFKTIYLHYW